MEELHGQTMTDGEHLIQLQQVGAQRGTLWSDGLHSSEHGRPEITCMHRLTRHRRHLTETFLMVFSKAGASHFCSFVY